MALQTIAVEFRVAGDLDGVTPAPSFTLDPQLPLPDEVAIDPDTGVYVVEVDGNLGLIDPTFFGGSAYADRFIKWMFIDAEEVAQITGLPNANVVTRDSDGNTVELEAALFIAAAQGNAGAYKKRCTFVPQGGLLQVQNVTGPSLVRLGLWRPETVKEVASMRQACCCREGGQFTIPDGSGGEITVDTGVIQIPDICKREIDFIKPDSVTLGQIQTVALVGKNFEASDVVSFVRDGGGGFLTFADVRFISSTLIEVDLDAGSYGAGPGSYTVLVGPTETPECTGFYPSAFTVEIP